MATRLTAGGQRKWGVVLTTTRSRVAAAVGTTICSGTLLLVGVPFAALAVGLAGLALVARAPEPQSAPHCLVPVPSAGPVIVRATKVASPGPVPGSTAVA